MRPIPAIRELLSIRPYHKALTARPVLADWQQLDYGEHPRQYCLVAQQPDTQAPVAVWFHGGGWQFGSPDKLVAFGEYFFARGYTVWMPSHRRMPRHPGRVVYADALRALRLVQDYSTTPPQLLLGGMSSGGHLATLAALRREDWLRSGRIHGLIACGAPLSLDKLGASPTRWRFAGKPNSERFTELDPTAQLSEVPNFPMRIIHGTEDGLVPYASAVGFASKAKRMGWADCELTTLPGGSHLDAAAWVSG